MNKLTLKGKRFSFAGALVLGVALVTTGCLGMGKSNDAKNIQASVGGSAGGLAAFQSGFWEFAKTNCSSCHGATQVPMFAVSDAQAAYGYAYSSQWIDFQDPGSSLFEARANDGHCGQASCVGKGAQAHDLLASWAAAELATPEGGGPPPVTPPASIKYFTQSIAIPAPLPTGATFAPMRYSLSALMPGNGLVTGATLEIEIQSLSATTYRVRNPKIVGLTTPVLVKGIHLFIRRSTEPAPGVEDPLATYWDTDQVNVQPRAAPATFPATPLTAAQAQIIDPYAMGVQVLSGSDFIAVGFDDLVPGTVVAPLGPTFGGVFANIIQPKCLGCHSGGAPSGGVSLVNYAAISGSVIPTNAAGSILFQAVTGATPVLMPVGGTPLNTAERNAISGWINAGALNN